MSLKKGCIGNNQIETLSDFLFKKKKKSFIKKKNKSGLCLFFYFQIFNFFFLFKKKNQTKLNFSQVDYSNFALNLTNWFQLVNPLDLIK